MGLENTDTTNVPPWASSLIFEEFSVLYVLQENLRCCLHYHKLYCYKGTPCIGYLAHGSMLSTSVSQLCSCVTSTQNKKLHFLLRACARVIQVAWYSKLETLIVKNLIAEDKVVRAQIHWLAFKENLKLADVQFTNSLFAHISKLPEGKQILYSASLTTCHMNEIEECLKHFLKTVDLTTQDCSSFMEVAKHQCIDLHDIDSSSVQFVNFSFESAKRRIHMIADTDVRCEIMLLWHKQLFYWLWDCSALL